MTTPTPKDDLTTPFNNDFHKHSSISFNRGSLEHVEAVGHVRLTWLEKLELRYPG